MRLRNPFRSEAEAFRFTIACAIGGAIVVGAALVSLWLGVVAASVLVVALLLGFLREPVPGLAEPPARIASGTPPGQHRILLLAPPGTELPPRLAEGEVLVVVPAVASKLEAATGAVDDRRAEAQRTADRLGAALGARAEVGADDPVLAVEDSLRMFGADEIVVLGGDGLTERIRERVAIPVTDG